MLVKVEIIRGAGAITTIVERAILRAQELARKSRGDASDSFDAEFEVWAVFDADNNSPASIHQVKQRARAAGVKVAFSNPCFEIWAIMHYRNVDGHLTHHNAQSELRRLMPSYNHNQGAEIDYEAIKKLYLTAAKRAEVSDRRRREEGAAEGNPFTGVYKLMAAIRAAANAVPFEK